MNEAPKNTAAQAAAVFSDRVSAKVARRLRAQRRGDRTVWSGLGMYGMIGWSVVIPTLLGAALGMWLDKHYPGKHVWTLALLMAGLALGCFSAWHWIDKEDKAMHDDDDE